MVIRKKNDSDRGSRCNSQQLSNYFTIENIERKDRKAGTANKYVINQ